MPNDPTPRPLWREHLGLVLSGGLTLLPALKLLALGGFEPETALGIVQVSGTGNIIVPAIISLIPLLVILGSMEYWIWRKPRNPLMSSDERLSRSTVMFLPAALVLVVVPVLNVALLLAVPFLYWFGGRKDRRAARRGRLPEDKPLSSLGSRLNWTEQLWIRAPMIVAALFATIQSPWLPTEAVTVDNDDPIEAYIIGERGEDTVILPTNPSKGLLIETTSDVERDYCDDRSLLSVTIVQVFRKPTYAKCPDD